jgi:hypothetical protein
MDLTELEKVLLAPDFDVEKHASNLLQSSVDMAKYGNELAEAESELDGKLEDHVSVHHNELLSQATSVERLETHLSSVSEQSGSLLSSVDRLKSRINEPYESIKTQTVTLMRLQKTCDMLRKIIRILQLSKKLQSQLQGGPAEITKAASSLSELLELWQPEDELNGVELIEQDQRVLLHAKNEVERSADTMLASGMESKSQNQMGIALQVYFNLNVLPEKIDQVLGDHLKDVKAKVGEYLDARKINSAVMEEAAAAVPNQARNVPGRSNRAMSSVPTSGNLAAFRSLLWINIEALLDFVFSKVCEAMQLQKILAKKRDIVLGVNFIELIEEKKRNVVHNFWTEILSLLKTSFHQASVDSSTIKQSLEGEFPKLIRLFNDLWSRLCQASINSSAAGNIADLNVVLKNPFDDRSEISDNLRQVLVAFERQYLSRSLSRLFDPVNLMFVAGEAPKIDELDQVFKAINSEIAIAQVDKGLSNTVIKNVAKTVRLMCAKSEQLLDGHASQVVGYPTTEQRRNVEIVNCLFAFYAGVEIIMDNNEVLKEMEKLIQSAIEPLIGSVKDAVEAIILTMHNENFKIEAFDTATATPSPYMRELQTFVARVHLDFLSKFNCKTLVSESCFPLAAKSVELFILHASLIRPLTEGGQLRLAHDCDQIETALEPLLNTVSTWDRSAMDKSMQELAAFKILVTTKTEDIPELASIKERTLKHSTVLHVLFARASVEMKSPHESVGWSISRYSAWLEDHTNEADRLQLIQGALESYVASTRARKEKSFVYPYNLMLNMLQSAL